MGDGYRYLIEAEYFNIYFRVTLAKKKKLLEETGFATAQLTEMAMAASGARVCHRGEMVAGKVKRDF